MGNPLYAKPVHNSLKKKIKTGGRNHRGKITVYHRGGGHKQRYREIEFHRAFKEALVTNIEYDPNRSAFIARIEDKQKKESYILAPQHLKIGMTVQTGLKTDFQVGNCLPLAKIPLGSSIHNLSIKARKGGQYARAAGTFAQLLQKTAKMGRIRLASGEQRYVPLDCFATLGMVSNENHKNERLGKAGRSRWLGIKPTVRGVAMNPIDHPHGGGEGKTSGGRPSVTPWGKLTKGQPTRCKKKKDSLLIQSRKKKNAKI